ncbi:peptidyl-prolyl cis-trans isomerase [Novosphingobium sp. Rr 2-17]|uniref:peptidylprolyl isomerase n=1 Tax=Novosphingobium sp. Rr 2-17 TaxID=555793 RepID=UPI0002697B81|nr:peptidylprolyl isomerase [Novosphingobium sp. Rr 2-17]EIZ78983.1 peptidyl-prolyl cis-trans isomerase [Novosphingobium sp. Rr 2-17]
MFKTLIGLAAASLFSLPVLAQGASPPSQMKTSSQTKIPPLSLTPNAVVAAAPASEWRRIAPADLVVMDLAPDGEGRPRRVVIQLMPAPFSQGWVGNIRKLVAAHWFDGVAVVRVQDNYVVQWGDPDGETPGKAKPLPPGLRLVPESEYTAPLGAERTVMRTTKAASEVDASVRRLLNPDAYARGSVAMVRGGWPVAMNLKQVWPLHCYGMVGVGRNNSPDTGTGAELYTVIGQAPRQLDRNIALVGRIIAGMEHLSSLPRGTGELGFYKTAQERTPIISVRMGDAVQGLPGYEYLSSESASFAAYVGKRSNRKDAFYIQPAGGVDVCNVPVPIREVKP